ncbi:hypothetical protein DXG01_008681 [Tephrocybe rancida]|nr:hypothetical protein DXG01_008681 [Tephrocybe rancida]
MIPADNKPTAQPAAVPDGKNPSLGKRFLNRAKDSKSTESSSALNTHTTRSMDLTAPDGKKPSAVKRLLGRLGVSKPTKSSLVSSTAATQSVENVTVPAPASAAQPAANVLGVVTAPAVSRAAASIQVVTDMGTTSAINVDQGGSMPPVGTHALLFTLARTHTYAAAGPTSAMNVDHRGSVTAVAMGLQSAMNAGRRSSMTPAAYTVAGPTSAMNIDERSSTPKVVVSYNDPSKHASLSLFHLPPPIDSAATNPVSLTNINQYSPPGPNVPQDRSKFKEGVDVALDGFLTALRIARDSSDWNPFLKAALSSVVAVIDLAKAVSDNSQDMKDTLVRIQGLLPILETSAKRLEGRKDGFGKGNNLMTFAIMMQAELEKIQQMQSHGLFRRVLQGSKDAGTLLGAYKNISEVLEQFKPDGEPVYWLTGPAGIGKTTIAKTICELVDDRESDCLAEALEKDSELAHGNVKIQLKQMLIQPWKASASDRVGLPPLIIVVDALDENQSGSAFLQHLLQAVAATELRGLKFFVTSREDEQISRLCNILPQGTVLHLQDIQKQIVQNDIGLYLTQSLPGIHSNTSYQDLLGKLKQRSDGLFIYAATVVKMVTANDAAVTEQVELLQGIIDWSDSPQLGDLYCQIVKDVVGLRKSNVQASRLQVLHTILCAMHPISETVVAQLAKTTLDVVTTVLKKLHAVMYKAHDGMIYTYHASFADYILQTPIAAETAFDLHCNVSLQHAFLAQRCYNIMEKQLCFNICGLESSFVKDADVPDLQKHIQDKIGSLLKYAVLTWMAHLNSATDPDKALVNDPQLFIEKLLLYWVEVVNLLNARREGMQMLDMFKSWINRYTPNTLGLWEEACKFYQFFVSGSASAYTPHLYISALSCWNPKSEIAKIWQPHFPYIPKITAAYMSAHLMTIQVSSSVTGIGISPDGKQLVSGSHDKSVCIWDALTGDLVKDLRGHTDSVQSVAFSPDGKQVVSGSFDKSVHIWDALTGDFVKELKGHTDLVLSVAFSPDGKQVVSGSIDKSVCIWDALTGHLLKDLKGHTHWVQSVAFSPDGKHVVSGSNDKSVCIWDALIGDLVKELKGHTDFVGSVLFSPDGKQVVSGSGDRSVCIWDALTGSLVKELKGHTDGVQSVAFSSDGKQVVSGSNDKSVCIWDVLTGHLLKELKGHTDWVLSVAFSPDKKQVVSGSNDKSVRIWDALIGGLVKELKGHTDWVQSVVFSPDGKQVVSGSSDKSVHIWDALTGGLVKELKGHTDWVQSVSFSLDGKQVVSGSDDQSVCIWDALTGDLAKELKGHTDFVRSVVFSPDGKQVVSGSEDKSVHIWDALTGDLVKELKGHTDGVQSVAFSPDGKQVVSGSNDQSLCIWDALAGDLVKELKGHTDFVGSVAFSPDGKQVVSGSDDKSVCIWDALTGDLVKELKGHTDFVGSVAFSPDGKQVVSGSNDKSVCIWDALTGDLLKKLKGHTDFVRSVAFSPDGKQVVSGSNDQSVRIWDALTRDLVKQLMGQPLATSNDKSLILKTIECASDVDLWTFNQHTGWISSQAGHLMLWLPEQMCSAVYTPSTRLIISSQPPTHVVFDSRCLGNGWVKIFSLNV